MRHGSLKPWGGEKGRREESALFSFSSPFECIFPLPLFTPQADWNLNGTDCMWTVCGLLQALFSLCPVWILTGAPSSCKR